MKGLLKAIVYVDLVGLSEDDAKLALLGAFSGRAKPATSPAFPGAPRTAPAMPRVAPTLKSLNETTTVNVSQFQSAIIWERASHASTFHTRRLSFSNRAARKSKTVGAIASK